jgi:hypothetical protein
MSPRCGQRSRALGPTASPPDQQRRHPVFGTATHPIEGNTVSAVIGRDYNDAAGRSGTSWMRYTCALLWMTSCQPSQRSFGSRLKLLHGKCLVRVRSMASVQSPSPLRNSARVWLSALYLESRGVKMPQCAIRNTVTPLAGVSSRFDRQLTPSRHGHVDHESAF